MFIIDGHGSTSAASSDSRHLGPCDLGMGFLDRLANSFERLDGIGKIGKLRKHFPELVQSFDRNAERRAGKMNIARANDHVIGHGSFLNFGRFGNQRNGEIQLHLQPQRFRLVTTEQRDGRAGFLYQQRTNDLAN